MAEHFNRITVLTGQVRKYGSVVRFGVRNYLRGFPGFTGAVSFARV
jgi:hypothetical protein